MADIPLVGAPGTLFNRTGKIALVLSQLDSYQNAQRTNLIDQVNGVVGQYLTEPDLYALIGDAYIGMLNSQSYGSWMQNLLRLTINRMVFNAQPRLGQTLQGINVLDSIYEVLLRMCPN